MDIKSEKVSIDINNYSVTAELLIPEDFNQAIIIANGAGANMHNAFISGYCKKLADAGFMTIKFNFHYQEIGRKIPDKNEKCQETYLAVISFLKNNYLNENKITIAGKSMGGRIATQIAGQVACENIVVFGYPLHPPGKPDKLRDAHLYDIKQNVLIIQGESDAFGNREELQPVVQKMSRAQVIFITQGNHSLKAPKKSGQDNNQIEKMILDQVIQFLNKP